MDDSIANVHGCRGGIDGDIIVKQAALAAVVERTFTDQTQSAGPAPAVLAIYSSVIAQVIDARRRRGDRPTVLGICGPQGSGKSTMTQVLKAALSEIAGLSVATLSLDDLYLSGAERAALARDVHPLLRTRGVPGTHDVALGIRVIERLLSAQPDEQILLPRFDKALDEPSPVLQCEPFRGRADLVIFEGWCVGAVPQDADALVEPINSLELNEDAQAHWRQYVNDQLAGRYQSLFGLVDVLLMLRAPGFEHVFRWRQSQERQLARRFDATQGGAAASRIMNDTQLSRFIMHYERLTRHTLAEMPARAHLVVTLDEDRQMTALERRTDS